MVTRWESSLNPWQPHRLGQLLSLSLNSTKRVDHSNTRLVTQLDRNPGVYPATQGIFGQGLLGREPHFICHFVHLSVCPEFQALMTTTSTPFSMST